MTEWQIRVMVEFEELDSRTKALGKFLGSPLTENISFDDQMLLWQQYAAMMTYCHVLVARISRFVGKS